MSINIDRIHNAVKNKVEILIEPQIKKSIADQKDISVSSLKTSDWEDIRNNAVNGIMAQLGILIEEIINEIKANAEIDVSVAVPAEDLGEVTVMPGTFSQGAGTAAIPNPAAVVIKINKIVIPKGKIS